MRSVAAPGAPLSMFVMFIMGGLYIAPVLRTASDGAQTVVTETAAATAAVVEAFGQEAHRAVHVAGGHIADLVWLATIASAAVMVYAAVVAGRALSRTRRPE